jgi:hypothetical protein
MTNSSLQWHVSLADSEPPIWRRFLIGDAATLDTLHQVLQQVMGWSNTHPYMFVVEGDRYAHPAFSLENTRDSTATALPDLSLTPESSLAYTYDFGDGWLHILTLEERRLQTPLDEIPCCLDGERACPPENSGGVWGYEDLLERLGDPDDPDYEDLLNQIGLDFDSEAFSPETANQRLKAL